MPVTLTLREDGHVLHYKLVDPWSISELSALYPQEMEWAEKVNHKLHAFIDLSDVKKIPVGLLSIRNTSGPRPQHRNVGQMVIVGAKSFIRTMAETVFKISRNTRVSFFDTDEEAWTHLRRVIAEESMAAPSAVSSTPKAQL